MERLFKPFAQLDTGLTRRHGGTGLGLYISRAILRAHGGGLRYDPDGPGSRFTVELWPVELENQVEG